MADPLPIRGVEYHAGYLSDQDRNRNPKKPKSQSNVGQHDTDDNPDSSSTDSANESPKGIGGNIDFEA